MKEHWQFTSNSLVRLTRRAFLELGSAFLTAGLLGPVVAREDTKKSTPPIGFNLVSWNKMRYGDTGSWTKALQEIHALGIRHVTIVTYRFVNDRKGLISPNSEYGLAASPLHSTVETAIRLGKELGMVISLNPFIEIDNPRSIGSVWRGSLNFQQSKLRTFFMAYQAYIEEMAELAQSARADRLYVGSELTKLSRNPAALPFWTALIQRARKSFGGHGRQLAYAAHHDEFKSVPFWDELDEIGIDAYFSLSQRAEATGPGNPAVAKIVAGWQPWLRQLRGFSEQTHRPIIISEWGVVPFDLTTYQPWNWHPSEVADPTEQLNAYRATLEALQFQGHWLAEINYWHWQMDGNEGSHYGIAANSQVGSLIERFLKGSKIDGKTD
jgi:hypothetical protein